MLEENTRKRKKTYIEEEERDRRLTLKEMKSNIWKKWRNKELKNAKMIVPQEELHLEKLEEILRKLEEEKKKKAEKKEKEESRERNKEEGRRRKKEER